MKVFNKDSQDCIGFVVPEKYSVSGLVAVFRRANSHNSLDLMYERKVRDIESEEMATVHIKACLIDAYRAYLARGEEIDAGKYIGTRSKVAKPVVASASAVHPAEVVKPSKPAVQFDIPESKTVPARTSFAEAERALQAELSRLS